MIPSASHSPSPSQAPSPRIPSGVRGLDEMLNGGFLPQTANLVEGAPGTGKSVLGLQFIYHGITQYDEAGIILAFEESPQQYYRAAAAFGWDLPALERAQKLRLILSTPEMTYEDFQQVSGHLEQAAHDIRARRIVVDSITHFEYLTADPVVRRDMLYSFINGLKRMQLTSLLTRENPELLGAPSGDLEEDAAFVADSYLMLRYIELQAKLERALLILKLRGSNHDKDIRRYTIGAKGIEVQSRFEGARGLMSGTAHMTMAQAFQQAFPVGKRKK